MKAVLIVLGVLLVLAHPGAAAVVVGAELAAGTVLLGVILRAVRPLCLYPGRHRRTA